jgi:uncharacterized membrane protein YcaP (DUF421 family)
MEPISNILGLEQQQDLDWYQMVLRGIIVYIIALVLIRIAGMRAFGTRTPFETVLTITIGAILSRCITGHYPFFSCLAAAATLSVITRLVAFLSYHFDSIRKVTEGDATVLFENGVMHQKALRKYAIHEKDLERSLRENNITDLKEAEAIWYEANGKVTVIKKKK